MAHVELTLAADGDGTGELFARFEANGFSGHGSAWFDLKTLEEAARSFGAYPLRHDQPAIISGGVWSGSEPPTLREEHLHISAHATDARGGIGLRVKVVEVVLERGGREVPHSASAELRVTYEKLSTFSKSLAALARREVSKVVVEEENA
jgi:hypothetical protein